MPLEITFISAETFPQALERLEKVIEESFVKAGQAFKEIREGKLYRDTYPTFEEYCNKRWDYNRDYVNKLIRSSDIMIELDTIVSKNISEGVIRELHQLTDAEDRKKVVQEVLEKNPNPTAKDMRKAVEEKLIQNLPPTDKKVQKILQKNAKTIATFNREYTKIWAELMKKYCPPIPLSELEAAAKAIMANH